MSPASTSRSAPGAGVITASGWVSRCRSETSWSFTRLFCGGGAAHGGGQPDMEDRAAAGLAFDLDRAAVHLDAFLHDVQADSGALDVADVGAAMEGFEQPRQVALRDADAAVLHREHQPRVLVVLGR